MPEQLFSTFPVRTDPDIAVDKILGVAGDGTNLGDWVSIAVSELKKQIAPRFVKTLPDAADAINDVLYVRISDGTAWIRKSTPNSITHRRAHHVSGLDLLGVFDSDTSAPNQGDFYFNNVSNRFRLWTGIAWELRTLAEVLGNNRIGIDMGSGTPAPVESDTVAEAIAYLVENGYDSSQTYIFYDSATSYPNAVREIQTVGYEHEMIKITDALPGFKGNSYYDYADRTIVAAADRDTTTEVTITVSGGTVYNLHIEQNSDLIHLPDIDTGTSIRLSEGNTLWLGRIESVSVDTGVYTFKINFHVRRGTFTTGENIHIEFGSYPHSRTSFFYGWNQTERIPLDIMNDGIGGMIGAHELYANGIKRFTGNADHNIHGGIAYTFLNSNDITNADTKQDAPNTAIQIDESGHFHFRVKGFGSQQQDGNSRIKIFKIMSGTDDEILLSIAAWHSTPPTGDDPETVAEYFDEEPYIDVVSGDQYMFIMSGFISSQNLFAGYLEIERVD